MPSFYQIFFMMDTTNRPKFPTASALMTLIIIVTTCFGLSAQAGQVFSTSLWESQALPEAILSSDFGDADNDYKSDIVYVTEHSLVVMALDSATGGLAETARLQVGQKLGLHRVFLGDWDGDGLIDILFNGIQQDRILSRIYKLDGKSFVLKKEFSDLVVPLADEVQSVLYSQNYLGNATFSPQIQKLSWEEGAWKYSPASVLTKALSGNVMSLWGVALYENGLLQQTASDKLVQTDTQGKILFSSSMNYGGSPDVVMLPLHDGLGMKIEKNLFLPVPHIVSRDRIAVVRNEGYLKSVVGAVPSIKYAQLVSLSKTAVGLQEQKSSPRYPGAIADMKTVDYNGDGISELLILFRIKNDGYLDAYSGKQKSMIAVVSWPD